MGVQFHPAQKVWLWLTTKTQIVKAYELAKEKKIEPVCFFSLEQITEHEFLKNILCPSNRFGKTFVTSCKHVWYNFYKVGVMGDKDLRKDARYATLNISPHSMQVDAAYRYIVDIFQDKFIYYALDDDGELIRDEKGKPIKKRNYCRIKNHLIDYKQTRREIHFNDNSMIKGVPTGEDQASSLAGTQFFYISYDEAPQSLHLRKELPAKIQSRLIDSGGPLDIIGTPEVDKPSHVYYERITKYGLQMKNGFFTLRGTLHDNVFIGEKEKESVLSAIKSTDPDKYLQVAFGKFISSGAKTFDNRAIERLWDETIYSMQRGYENHDYIIGVDWGFSDTGDPTVFYVIDYTEMRNHKTSDLRGHVFYKIVYREAIKGGDPYAVLARLRILQNDFCEARVIHDSSSMGGVIIKKMLKEMSVRHIYDFSFAKSPKDDMLFLLVVAMNYGRVVEKNADGIPEDKFANFGKIRSYLLPELEEQLGNYKKDDTKIEQDEVMAFGLPIWWLEKKFAGQKTKVFNLNILANTPEQILKVDKVGIKTKNLKITERIIQ